MTLYFVIYMCKNEKINFLYFNLINNSTKFKFLSNNEQILNYGSLNKGHRTCSLYFSRLTWVHIYFLLINWKILYLFFADALQHRKIIFFQNGVNRNFSKSFN